MTNPNLPVELESPFSGLPVWSGWNGAFLTLYALVGGGSWTLADPAAADDEVASSRLNQNYLGPLAGDYVDIGCYLRELQMAKGATQDDGVLTRYESGVMTLELDNKNRLFDPTNIESAYYGRFDIGCEIQFRGGPAEFLDPSHPFYFRPWGLFRGYISSIVAGGYQESDPFVTVTVEDGTAILEAYNAAELSPAVGAGDTLNQRIDRILDEAQWPESYRLLAYIDSAATYAATTMAQPAWTELLLTGDAAHHIVFVDGWGRVMAVPQGGVATEVDDPVDVTWGADPDAGQVCLTDVEIMKDNTQLRNMIDLARTGGTQRTYINESSKAKYLPHRWQRMDLPLDNDGDVDELGGFLLAHSAEPVTQIRSMSVHPQLQARRDVTGSHTSPWDAVLPNCQYVGFGKQLVRVPHPTTDEIFEQYVVIQGVAMRVTPDFWEIRFVTSALDSFLDAWTLAHADWSLVDAEQSRLSRGHRLVNV